MRLGRRLISGLVVVGVMSLFMVQSGVQPIAAAASSTGAEASAEMRPQWWAEAGVAAAAGAASIGTASAVYTALIGTPAALAAGGAGAVAGGVGGFVGYAVASFLGGEEQVADVSDNMPAMSHQAFDH